MKRFCINHTVRWAQVIIPVLLFLIASCDRYELLSSSDTSLVGTVWKLEGFGSADGKLDIVKPVNEKNYQLLLESGGNAYGLSSANHLAGKYTLDEEKQTLGIDLQVLTYALDTPDGLLYLERLAKTYRYELQNNVLRLYYSENEYLQYRPAANDGYLREIVSNIMRRTPLASMLWKLEGFGVDKGMLTEARPNDEEVYLLYLQKNANAFGTTSVNTFRAEYKVDTTLGTITFGPLETTKINEQQDGKRYIDCLSRVTRYQHDNAILRLYYSEKEYLQYRPVADDTSFKKKITGLFGEIAW